MICLYITVVKVECVHEGDRHREGRQVTCGNVGAGRGVWEILELLVVLGCLGCYMWLQRCREHN